MLEENKKEVVLLLLNGNPVSLLGAEVLPASRGPSERTRALVRGHSAVVGTHSCGWEESFLNWHPC